MALSIAGIGGFHPLRSAQILIIDVQDYPFANASFYPGDGHCDRFAGGSAAEGAILADSPRKHPAIAATAAGGSDAVIPDDDHSPSQHGGYPS